MQLDIYLKTPAPLFSFDPADFEPLLKALPEMKLVFHESEAAMLEALPDIEYLDTWVFESTWYERAEKLQQIYTPAAGKNFVKTHPDIPVSFGKFHGPLMAETTLGLILNFNLRLIDFRTQQKEHLWQRLPLQRLHGQTALILGYGSIGAACGHLLSQLGMNVLGTKRQPTTDLDGDVQLISIANLPEYLPRADHVISFLPGDDDTKDFVSDEFLHLMSPKAYFYNLGRGTTVDEAALLDALQQNKIAGAALDVTGIEPLPPTSLLWDHPKIVVLPHTSAYFADYRHAHVTELTEQLRILQDSLPKN